MDEAEQAKLALSRIQGMARDRSGQVAEYDRAIERDLKVLEAQLQKQQVALDATFVEAQSALSRVRHLLESGLSSQADLELAVADFEAARTRQLNNREEIQRLDLQWEELRRGIYQIDAQDGALFTRQMEQSLQLQLLEAERALRHAEAASQSKDAELERAQRALDLQTRAEIVLPEYKSVFDIYTSEGAWVPRGTRIVSAVDCSHLLIDIELDDALLQLVEPGQQVEVRVFGSFKRRSATVVLVRGSAALSDSPVLAAAVKDRGTRKGRVLARIDSAADDEDPVQTCQIGRTAYAEFEDIGLFTLMFYPLFR